MILPTIRASLSRSDAQHLIGLLGRSDPDLGESASVRLERHGLDSVLDDPRVLNALLTESDVTVRPSVIYYVLVRQTLLEGGLEDRETADYVASVLSAFGRVGRAYKISTEAEGEFHYLVDMVSELRTAEARKRFLLRVHMGDFALWMAGLFPDYLEARASRKGAPSIAYFEELGADGYRSASQSPEAAELGLEGIFRGVADHFTGLRTALNRISDRHFWPASGNPVGRLLREVSGYAGP
jgi:hypothetical protein